MSEEMNTIQEESLPEKVRREMLQGISQNKTAREMGISPALLGQWLRGIYKGDNAAVEKKVDAWLERRSALRESAIPREPEWVETETARQVLQTLTYAQQMGDIVTIYGGAGLGKTTALNHYYEAGKKVWMTTMSPATTSIAAAMEQVGEAVGCYRFTKTTAQLARELVDRLDGTGGLLIIDEAQHMSIKSLESIRSLHDDTGIGVALVGNEIVYARMTGSGSRSAMFAQLFSRIGKRLHLVEPSESDVRTLATAWGVNGKREIELLEQIAQEPGALRGVTKVLRLAATLAVGNGQEIDRRYIQAAWRDLSGITISRVRARAASKG